MKKTKKLKQQIIVIYITTTMIVASVVSSYIFFKTHNYTRDTLESSYRSSSGLLFSKMESKIDSYCSYSYMLSRNLNLISILLDPYNIYDTVVALNSDIEPTIQFILESSAAIKSITIYTDESKQKIPSNYFEDISKIRDANWYEQATKLDGAFLMQENGNLFIICPIRNYHSHKIDTGLVRLDIDIDAFAEELQANYEDLCFTINDADGKQLFATAGNLPASRRIQLSQYDLNGTQITATFYVEENLLKTPAKEILLPILFILIVFLLLSYAFMYSINQIMFLRLERIMEQINLVDVNNFHICIDDDRNDEIGNLANCINNMSEKIDNLFSELSETKDKEKRAELEFLRAKIDPHFLYNIMDTINWIAIDGDTELIREITHELSVFYRTNLNYNETANTLFNEIENVNAYLNLQKIATSNGFDVEYEIDEQLLDYETCDFILQPLAENAIIHGIKPLKTRRGVVTVKLYEKDDCIYLVIADNGVGLHNNFTVRPGFKKTNYGIQNINERIKLTFGKDYGVTLDANSAGVGAIAKIKLPKINHSKNI